MDKLTPKTVARLREKIDSPWYWSRRLAKMEYLRDTFHTIGSCRRPNLVILGISEEYARRIPYYKRKVEEIMEFELGLDRSKFAELGVSPEKLHEVFGVNIPKTWLEE